MEKIELKCEVGLGEVYDLDESQVRVAMATVTDSGAVFDEDAYGSRELPVPGYEGAYSYIPWGADDMMPYHMMREIRGDEILSQNMYFSVLTAYGDGLRYTDLKTGRAAAGEIGRWCMGQSLHKLYLNQATDMKHFFFAVAVLILSNDGSHIAQVRHKEACYCRFEKADRRGRVNHVFYGPWRKAQGNIGRKDIEVIQLLDEDDPLGHLEVLMGRRMGTDGETRVRTANRKFGVVMKFPTVWLQYYPVPYYTAVFRGDWYDLKRLIGRGKKAKIRNHSAVKYQVEIDRQFWVDLVNAENITDPVAQRERINREKEAIKKFVCGIENSGKAWITGCYTNPDGREQHLVRINVIDTAKEGGDWSDDIAEAANMLCYGFNIHPNLVGATPGKSQTNNSGSDKRELFTLKQSLEKATRDCLEQLHQVIIYYNGWEEQVRAEVPLILLTTLDQNTDAKRVGEVNPQTPESGA